jgi:hypothetical protein
MQALTVTLLRRPVLANNPLTGHLDEHGPCADGVD